MVHRAAEVVKRKGAQKEEEALARLHRKDPAELSSHKKKKKASIYKLPTGHSQVHSDKRHYPPSPNLENVAIFFK